MPPDPSIVPPGERANIEQFTSLMVDRSKRPLFPPPPEALRFALVGDSHFCADSRFAETIRVHDYIADDIASQGVDFIAHGGDLWERRSVPEDRLAAALWIQTCANIAPFFIVRGNHDVVGDLQILAKLKAKHEISVCE